MESITSEGAIHIVHAAPEAADVESVPDIEPAESIQSNHVPGSPNSNDDSTSESNFLGP